MLHETEVRDLMDDMLEELALVIGGLAACCKLRDDAVRHLVTTLADVRARFLRRLEGGAPGRECQPGPEGAGPKPHPAITEFLLSLRKP